MNRTLFLLLVALGWSGSLFADVISLDDAIRHALVHSPRYAQARLDLKLAELNKRIEAVKFDPVISGSTSATDEADTRSHTGTLSKRFHGGWNLSSSLSRSSSPGSDDDRAWTLSVSKELLKGGTLLETRDGWHDAVADLLKEVHSLRVAKRQLVLDVRKRYYSLERRRQTLRIQEFRLERARQNLEHALEREEPMDIAIAKLEVPRNEIQLLNLRQQMASDLDALKVLIGLDVTFDVGVPELEMGALESIDLGSDLPIMLDENEELLNLELDIEKQKRQIRVQRWAQAPSLRLTGELDHSGTEDFDALEQDEKTVSLNLSWPLGVRSARHGLTREKLQLDRSLWELHRQRLDRTKELRDLSRRLDQAGKSIELERQQVKLQELRVEIYRERWNEGEIKILEVVRSEGDLENSRVNLVNQQIRYLEILEDYHFAVGRDRWEGDDGA